MKKSDEKVLVGGLKNCGVSSGGKEEGKKRERERGLCSAAIWPVH